MTETGMSPLHRPAGYRAIFRALLPAVILFMAVMPSRSQPIAITSPGSGARFSVGDTLVVKWGVDGDLSQIRSGVVIDVSLDKGVSWFCVSTKGSISPDDDEWGEYLWVIPAEICARSLDERGQHGSANCPMVSLAKDSIRLRLWEYYDPDNQAISPAFTIKTRTNSASRAPLRGPAGVRSGGTCLRVVMDGHRGESNLAHCPTPGIISPARNMFNIRGRSARTGAARGVVIFKSR